MKEYMTYQCNCCGFSSPLRLSVEECEAKCLGITIPQLNEYYDLLLRARAWESILRKDDSFINQIKAEKAVADVIDFEKRYNITKKDVRIHYLGSEV